MSTFRSVDASVLERPAKPSSAIDPARTGMVAKLSRITDPSVVYHVSEVEGENAATVRGRLLRAARVAGVELAVGSHRIAAACWG